MHHLLGALGVYLHQRIEVVQGVEEKVWMELAFEILKLGLGAVAFNLAALRLGTVPSGSHLYGHCKAYYQQIACNVPHKKTQFSKKGVLQLRKHMILLDRKQIEEGEVEPQH